MIEVKNLQKYIDNQLILNDINFTIKKGSIVGLLGRNGIGKTTLLKTLVGIFLPEKGSISFDNIEVTTHPEIKQKIIYVPDSSTFISQYKLNELVAFYQAVYPNFTVDLFQKLARRYKLPNTHIRSYSKGMKTLLSIILSFCTNAEYIILDEPTNGLDPIVKRQLLQLIIDEVAKHESTILISTHHLNEIEKIADTIMIMNNQTIESITALETVKTRFHKIQVAFKTPLPWQLECLQNITILNRIGAVYTILIEDHIESTLTKFRKELPILLEQLPMTLEDIFVMTLGVDDYVS